MQFASILRSLVVLSFLTIASSPQVTPSADELAARAKEDEIVTHFRKEGIKRETKRAVVWAERGSLTEREVEDFAALANKGIADIENISELSSIGTTIIRNKLNIF